MFCSYLVTKILCNLLSPVMKTYNKEALREPCIPERNIHKKSCLFSLFFVYCSVLCFNFRACFTAFRILFAAVAFSFLAYCISFFDYLIRFLVFYALI